MSEYLAKEDIWLTQAKLPAHVNAFCKCLNGDNCAVVNEDLDDAEKEKAIKHEVLHFFRNDLESDTVVDELERGME